jgi:4-hydroxy-3-polyprenylbenzoate decarboxylase
MRLVVGITGATGVVLGIRLLEVLRDLEVETHLVISRWGRATIRLETDYSPQQVERMATAAYSPDALAAPISSGSFPVDGMIVMPCTANTLATIRHGLSHTLIARSADVALKERRPLVLAARESPLSRIHLENMLALAGMGVTIMPPMLSCYTRPVTVAEVVDHVVARALDQFGLSVDGVPRWTGPWERACREGG